MTPTLADRLAVYAITPDGFDPQLHEAQLLAAFSAGLRCIQLRDKAAGPAELLTRARFWRRLTAVHGVLLIVNDNPDLAAEVGADGVHLGPSDAPPARVRADHPTMLVGGSANSLERALRLADEGVHYLGVGAIFDASATKPDAAHHRGTALLRELRGEPRLDHLPLIAIGGITGSNAADCFRAGASGVAAVRAILGDPDPAAAVRTLLACRQESGGMPR